MTRATRLSVAALSIVLLAAISVPSYASGNFKAATPVVILMPHALNNVDMLEISDQQKHQLRSIAQQMNREREDNDTLSVELRRELSELTKMYRPDAKLQQEVRSLLAKTEQRRVEMSVECADQLRQILTEEQWSLLLELAADAHH